MDSCVCVCVCVGLSWWYAGWWGNQEVGFIICSVCSYRYCSHIERESHCRGLTAVREESGRKRSHPQRGVSFFLLLLFLSLTFWPCKLAYTGNKQRPRKRERKKERKKEKKKAFAMWLVDSQPHLRGLKAAGKEWGPPFLGLLLYFLYTSSLTYGMHHAARPAAWQRCLTFALLARPSFSLISLLSFFRREKKINKYMYNKYF